MTWIKAKKNYNYKTLKNKIKINNKNEFKKNL